MTKLWGSRFKKTSDPLADQFSYSISYDYRLAPYDVLAGIAHAKMLGKCKIISLVDSRKIVSGLKKIGKQIQDGRFNFDPKSEDVHTNIQQALKKLIGPAADKLHTARSRNDLIVTDMKMYCMAHIGAIIEELRILQLSILKFAEKNFDIIIPAYTHLQSAQVVLLAHHMIAYVEMIERDKSRLIDTFLRTDEMPLGSGAMSGTTLPIDRKFVSEELGFLKPTDNSIDSVSDRDFIAELLSNLAILGMHFSRMSEDLILWVTDEFNRVTIDDAYCTGSSIMPHKKNPDMLELIRGESANLASNFNQLIMLLKGLPFTYNRDLQLDKPPLFESVEKSLLMTTIMSGIFQTLRVDDNQKIMINYDITSNENFFSVDIVDYLINKGHSYREAHDIVGKLTNDIEGLDTTLNEISIKELKRYSPKFDSDVKKLLNPETSVKMKKSHGSTNPSMVKKQLEKWKRKLK